MLAASASTLFDFSVEQCGALARPMFRGTQQGHVTAVFDHSFYIDIEGATACIVARNAISAPFNLVTTAAHNVSWQASGLRAASGVLFCNDSFLVANVFRFHMARAQTWTPPKPAQDWNLTTLRSGLASIRSIAVKRAPAEGLGRLICQSEARTAPEALLKQAGPAVDMLRTALSASLKAPHLALVPQFDGAHTLLGLGPGLTPSGDDFVGGIMIALHIAGHSEISDQLWRSVSAVAGERTHQIARAHLEGASKGMGSAAVHQLLNAVLAGRNGDHAELIKDIDQLGHTSGWDIIAGAICVFDLLSQAC